MKTFPNTEAYAISYIPGTAGTFIGLLIAEFHNMVKKSEFSVHGHSHGSSVSWNQKPATDFVQTMLPSGQIFSKFLETEPIDTSIPIILLEHYEIDSNVYFNRYPKGKILYIQADHSDRLLIEANFFFKVQVDSYHTIPYWHELWKKEAPIYFDNAETPYDSKVTPERIAILLKDRICKNQTTYPYLITDEIDAYRFSFSDILNDSQKILSEISSITKKPIPSTAHAMYSNYLKAQQPITDFLNKYVKS